MQSIPAGGAFTFQAILRTNAEGLPLGTQRAVAEAAYAVVAPAEPARTRTLVPCLSAEMAGGGGREGGGRERKGRRRRFV